MVIVPGARRKAVCQTLGITLHTHQRWTYAGSLKADGRPQAKRPDPKNKLSADERAAVLAACHRPEFASLPPTQIVPRLADEGIFVGVELDQEIRQLRA